MLGLHGGLHANHTVNYEEKRSNTLHLAKKRKRPNVVKFTKFLAPRLKRDACLCPE